MAHAEIPRTVLTVPLKSSHRISLHFILPPLLHILIFMFELATTIELSWSLNKVGMPVLTGVTIFLVYLPALVTTIVVLTRGLKDTPIIKKIAFALIASLAFPAWAVYRLSHRIFWAIEASLIHHRQGSTAEESENAKNSKAIKEWGPRGEEVERALAHSVESSSAELYLFLRAFLFSLPNSFLHSIIILAGMYDIVKGYDTYRLEAASLFLSLMYLSMTAAYYQIFESQRLLGRKFPWRQKSRKQEKEPIKGRIMAMECRIEVERHETKEQDEDGQEITGKHAMSEMEPLSKGTLEGCNQTDDEKAVKPESTSQPSPPSSPSSPGVILRHPPILPSTGAVGTYQGFYLPIPSEPAPPPPKSRPPRIPGGFRDIFCDSVSSAATSRVSRNQSFRSTLLGWPPNLKAFRHSQQSTTENVLPHTPLQGVFPALPTRAVSKKIIKLYGLEYDDAIGLCVSFSRWFLLLVARALALGNAFNYFEKPTLGLCAAHVLFIFIFLVRREGPPYFIQRKLALRLALAVVSMSGVFLELGAIPFGPRVPIMHDTLIITEDLALGLTWLFATPDDSWWHSYTFYACLGAHILSFTSLLFYTYILRPKKKEIPQETEEDGKSQRQD